MQTLCRVLMFYFHLQTDTFKTLDKDESGEIELGFMEVRACYKDKNKK